MVWCCVFCWLLSHPLCLSLLLLSLPALRYEHIFGVTFLIIFYRLRLGLNLLLPSIMFYSFRFVYCFFPFICFLLSCCCVKLCSSFLLLLSIFYLFVFCVLVVVSFQHTFPQHTEIQRILFATLQLGISAVHFYIFCWWFWFLFFFDCILYNSFWFYVFLWFMLFSILRFESIAFS